MTPVVYEYYVAYTIDVRKQGITVVGFNTFVYYVLRFIRVLNGN